MDAIIVHYNWFQFEELLPLLADYNVILYNKSSTPYTRNKITVKDVPNVGREAYTYLTHIIDNYDNLSEYTLFMQDDTYNHILNYNTFINNNKKIIDAKIKYYAHECC